jgi:IclR family transcriptional regulator, acetate operon repressor
MAGFSLNSAGQCLGILELLVEHREGLHLKQISESVGSAASATHRLLTVLRERGYVSQDPSSGVYFPTLLFAIMGSRVLSSTKLIDLCQPVLDKLALESSELARLSVLEDGNLIWVAKAQGSQSNIRYEPVDGQIAPLHATAMGKAWLSSMPEEQALRLITERGLHARMEGPNVIHSIEKLRADLAEARRSGYGIVDEEAEPGVSAIAVVVREKGLPEGAVVGCLSIGGPTHRLRRERLLSFAPPLRDAANNLGKMWVGRRDAGSIGSTGRS